MPYGECKIYFDGSHYIGIPHTTRPSRRRPKPSEEEIVVTEKEIEPTIETEENVRAEESAPSNDDAPIALEKNTELSKSKPQPEQQPKVRTMTRKELFDELYKSTAGKTRNDRKKFIIHSMKPYFNDEKSTIMYVNEQFERKLRNLICRRVRLTRKVNLQEFNFFCTFTYDGEKHTEESFKKKLQGCFKMMCHRKDWKYVGVWERSPEKHRLHFHGLFYIPEGSMPGKLIEVMDYSPIKKRVQKTVQNTYFNERFGRSDFKAVEDRSMLGEAVAYLTKYMEKTGEKMVYSKGLPQFFISDIMDEDIVCPIGLEDKKLLLFDDFSCWDEGCYMGKVSKAVIEQMRKCN
ncbi:MAG: hypothetical protein KIC36_05085 [Clostridium sp.]|nr:hypothetical protein [Clostridium sp.]